MSDTLLAAKTRIPPFRSNLVNRSRLIQHLNIGVAQNHRLILLSAPAGYGKSTILSEWVSQLEFPVAWFSIDKGDNTLTRFWSYFTTALSAIPQIHQAGIDEAFSHAFQSPQPPPMEVLLTNLLNVLDELSTKVLLVLDDLQTITDGQIHQNLIFLIDHLHPASNQEQNGDCR